MNNDITEIHHEVRSSVASLYSSLSAIQENLYDPETCKELIDLIMKSRLKIENKIDSILEIENLENKQ